MVVDLISQPRFFAGAAMGLTAGLAISRAVLTEREITISFFGLFMW